MRKMLLTLSSLMLLQFGCNKWNYCRLNYVEMDPDLGEVVDPNYKFSREEVMLISNILAYYRIDFEVDSNSNEILIPPATCEDINLIANIIMKSKDSSWLMEHLQMYPDARQVEPGK